MTKKEMKTLKRRAAEDLQDRMDQLDDLKDIENIISAKRKKFDDQHQMDAEIDNAKF